MDCRGEGEGDQERETSASPPSSTRCGRVALIAKQGVIGDLRQVLASHPRMHSAEGFFYRDVLIEACGIPTRIISP